VSRLGHFLGTLRAAMKLQPRYETILAGLLVENRARFEGGQKKEKGSVLGQF
jgi:hypothetical protein